MKKILIILCAAIALVAFAQNRTMTQRQKLQIAEMAIDQYYVDTVNEQQIVEAAIRGMLKELDPHSSYTTAEETREMNEPLEGKFSGIGVQFNLLKDTVYVIQTVVGGPSEKVGILAGDRIIAANDTVIAGVKMKQKDIMKRLRGPKGSKVTLKIKRGDSPEPIEFVVTRADIPIYSISASYMQDAETGYIYISRFAESTHDEFMEAANKLKKQGMKRLIIDLQSNGGGFLLPAAKIANEFLNRGNLIVYTEGKAAPRYEELATGGGKLRDIPVTILIDQYSASASEILTGALQDWDRAVVVGRRSFGKGLVQRPFPFTDGSMIRLTIARYYTPSGRCIQKPYNKGDRSEYDKDIVDRYDHGEFYSADSIKFNDSLRYTTIHNQRTIFGGGGIMPDCFVPLDTTELTAYYRGLVAKGVVTQYAMDYMDKNRKSLMAQYKNFDKFNTNFDVNESMLTEIRERGDSAKVKFNDEEFKRSANLIGHIVKAIIGRDLFEESDYYRVMNSHNAIFREGLAIINDPEKYAAYLKKKEINGKIE